MASYTDIFGGAVVNPALLSYLSINLNANITLSWPTQFQDTNNVVSNIMDVSPTANGFTLTMPDAKDVSVGQSVLINNPTGNTFALNKNDGNLLTNVNATSLVYIYLIDNTTVGGTWRASSFGGGGTHVTSVGAVSANADITIAGSPITVAGTFTFDLAGNLLSLSGLTPPGGITALTGANTFTLRTITGAGNQIDVVNGDGVAGNPVLSLDPNITGINSLRVGNFSIIGNVISATNANGHIGLSPLGNGSIDIINPAVPANAAYSSLVSGSLNTGPAANIALQLPIVAPLAGQAIIATAAVSPYPLGWATVATIVGGATIDAVPRFANVGGNLKDSAVFIDDSNNVLLGSLISPPGAINSVTSNGINFKNTNNANIIRLSATNPTGNYSLFLPQTSDTLHTLLYSSDGAGQLEFTSNAIKITGIGRAWGVVNGADGALLNGYNVASSRTGTGVYLVSLPIAFGNTNYTVNISTTASARVAYYTIVDAASFNVHVTDFTPTAQDNTFSFACYGT